MIIDNIDDFYENHKEAWLEILDVLSCNDKFFPTDIYTNAIINRAIALNDAFVKLTNMNNYVAAPTFIRMQIDNCLSAYAGVIVADVLGLINHVLAGKDLYKLKDKRKNQMYEKYVVQEIHKAYKERNFKQAYNYYNDDVHLSHKHFRYAHYVENNKMSFSLEKGNYYNYSEIDAHRGNMCAVNRILKSILLNHWLPYKQSQLEMIRCKHEDENMSMNDIMKGLLQDYPEIVNLLSKPKDND